MGSNRLFQTVVTLIESERYDRIFFDGFAMLQYAERLRQIPAENTHMKHNLQKRRWVYIDDEDITDLMRQRAQTTTNIFLSIFFWSEYFKSINYEGRMFGLVSNIWAISPRTAQRLRSVTGTKIVVMPTPVPKHPFAFRTKSRNIMFTGLLSWLENTAGMEWFLRVVWPTVLQVHPHTKLYVVGQMAKPDFISLISKYPNVVYKGFVPDLEKLYQQTAVAIAPILINCGIKVKVVTYLSYGLPVVSTVAAAWGLTNMWGVLAASDADDFAQSIITLLSDDTLRLQTAKQAYRNCQKNHSNQALKSFFKKVGI